MRKSFPSRCIVGDVTHVAVQSCDVHYSFFSSFLYFQIGGLFFLCITSSVFFLQKIKPTARFRIRFFFTIVDFKTYFYPYWSGLIFFIWRFKKKYSFGSVNAMAKQNTDLYCYWMYTCFFQIKLWNWWDIVTVSLTDWFACDTTMNNECTVQFDEVERKNRHH